MMTQATDIFQFWFQQIDRKLWFKKDADFDESIRQKFSAIYEQALRGETYSWRASAQGRLAEIIVLDQFSRNMFRESPRSFAADGIALILAQEAVAATADKDLPPEQKSFLYMPYMHSESRLIHEQAVKLFSQKGLEDNLNFEKRHRAIIERFGRFPHRNKILGRPSTAEESEFLKQPGSSF